MTDLIETKKTLDNISKTMCFAKWSQATIHLHNGHNHSCHHPKTHKINIDEIKKDPSALHNTEYKKSQRKLMLTDKKPVECNYCWNIENLNLTSDRIIKSSDDWSYSIKDEIINIGYQKNINPRYLELSFSNVCNLKCSYCAPQFSSKWMEEINEFGGYDTQYSYNNKKWLEIHDKFPILERENNPYIEAFWKWWPNLYKDLKVFRITGGEPLLSKHTFKILDWFIENPNPELRLEINSNFNVPQNNIDKLIEKVEIITQNKCVKEFNMYASIDTSGKHAEYIRYGLNYSEFNKNTRKFLDKCHHAKLTFMIAFNILSVFRFNNFLKDILRLKNIFKSPENKYLSRVFIDIPYLRAPHHMNIKIHEGEFNNLLEESLTFMNDNRDKNINLIGFYDHEILKMNNLVEYSKTFYDNEFNLKYAQRDFYSFFKEHDRRRNTDIIKTFPEITNFWEKCKKLDDIFNEYRNAK